MACIFHWQITLLISLLQPWFSSWGKVVLDPDQVHCLAVWGRAVQSGPATWASPGSTLDLQNLSPTDHGPAGQKQQQSLQGCYVWRSAVLKLPPRLPHFFLGFPLMRKSKSIWFPQVLNSNFSCLVSFLSLLFFKKLRSNWHVTLC